jgi:hypothetical protein
MRGTTWECRIDSGYGRRSTQCRNRLWVSIQPPLPWAPGVSFPDSKRAQGVKLTTHLHLVPNICWLYASTPSYVLMARCLIQHILLLLLMGWDWVHLVRRPLTGLLYQPRMIADGEWGASGGMKSGMGNRSTRRKPAPAPLGPDPGSNPGRHGGKPMTNRLNYGRAIEHRLHRLCAYRPFYPMLPGPDALV